MPHCAAIHRKLVSYQGNEFRIGRFSLGIADGIAEKSLQGIQVASVPGHFDGVADSTLDTAGGGLECFCHLGVQYLGDSVDDIHVVYRNDDGFAQVLVAFDMGGNTDLVDDAGDHGFDAVGQRVYGVNALVFIKLLSLYQKQGTSATAASWKCGFIAFVWNRGSHRQNQSKSNCGIMKERGIGSSQFLFLHTPS